MIVKSNLLARENRPPRCQGTMFTYGKSSISVVGRTWKPRLGTTNGKQTGLGKRPSKRSIDGSGPFKSNESIRYSHFGSAAGNRAPAGLALYYSLLMQKGT